VSAYESADPVECLCDDAKLIKPSSNVLQIHQSSCSQEADRRGYNQSVVSYSLFGHPDENDEVLTQDFNLGCSAYILITLSCACANYCPDVHSPPPLSVQTLYARDSPNRDVSN
jgi:hypothetical protein